MSGIYEPNVSHEGIVVNPTTVSHLFTIFKMKGIVTFLLAPVLLVHAAQPLFSTSAFSSSCQSVSVTMYHYAFSFFLRPHLLVRRQSRQQVLLLDVLVPRYFRI
jgi:hypothetical protein